MEIAIVLVIIGLLLGGILKGQELINNAKVRAIADRQNSLKVAWFSFIDRFGALPGDYVQAHIYITGASAGDGDGILLSYHSPRAFQHMTSAGYLRCPQCTETQDEFPEAFNSLINTYGGIMSIWHDNNYYSIRGGASNGTPRLMIHTGGRIPSNIIAEVDRKIDDGSPNSGDFSFNYYDNFPANRPKTAECMKLDETGGKDGDLYANQVQYWRPANSSPPIEQNCGGSVFI